MSLTKASIAHSLTELLDLPRPTSAQLVESVLDIIKQALESGEEVMISGFGKFSVKAKADRRGRNPVTGEELILAPRKVVTFKCSGKLRNRLNA